MSAITPYRIFDLILLRKQLLSPGMARLTFGGEQIIHMATYAPDQRIKMFFPTKDGRAPQIPHRGDWYDLYRELPLAERAPMRTYTIRHLRADICEVDVDFVLHGDNGPASRWAGHCQPGDRLQMSAPNRDSTGEQTGYEWSPPVDAEKILLIADHTALPAAIGIIDELAALATPPQTQAFFEIPTADDRLELPSWNGLEVNWMARENAGATYGALMVQATASADIPDTALASTAAIGLPDVENDTDKMWDRADTQDGRFYGWVAGESDAVRRIRTHLVKERGIDRKSLNLMGYWKEGRERD
ncbi:siderophore-interacting protein [Agrobacterium tumefaciens]|uniref:siderophore-interacting protein n=1 Tax=Agrobacterium tumefaciens TaxID=358 RepID=UPI000976BB65|nr:NADPH-dependent ferric siderophore reductase [Agrobacterium tumefaciens]